MDKPLKSLMWIAGILALGICSRAGYSQEAEGEQTAKVEEPTAAIPETPTDEYYELMRVFVDTFEQIDRNYVKSVDRRELMEAAVRGMLSKLDPYSNYISPEDLDHFTESVEQEFGGIGIQVDWDKEKREIIVIAPLAGSPAYTAGIHAGDRIVEIEGKPVGEFPLEREIQEAIKLLKGEPGVDVQVGVRHTGEESIEQITLTRAIIQLDTVLGDTRSLDGAWNYMIDDEQKIGYIWLTHFTRRSAEEMRSALQALKNQGMQGLVIDLRNNPGGLLQSAVDIADMFVDEGVIVSTEGRNSREKQWFAKKFGTHTGFPIAVLVNRFSASASEILSACLQDHERAVVIGERSWGKGSVQNVIELEEGESALKLTTASYHRPSGKNIHRFPGAKESDEWGVSPNEGYTVPFSDAQIAEWQSNRRTRGIPSDEPPPASEFVDLQLDKAIEYLTKAISDAEEAPAEPTDEEKPAEEQPAEKKAAA